jgi:hypothetical protein
MALTSSIILSISVVFMILGFGRDDKGFLAILGGIL